MFTPCRTGSIHRLRSICMKKKMEFPSCYDRYRISTLKKANLILIREIHLDVLVIPWMLEISHIFIFAGLRATLNFRLLEMNSLNHQNCQKLLSWKSFHTLTTGCEIWQYHPPWNLLPAFRSSFDMKQGYARLLESSIQMNSGTAESWKKREKLTHLRWSSSYFFHLTVWIGAPGYHWNSTHENNTDLEKLNTRKVANSSIEITLSSSLSLTAKSLYLLQPGHNKREKIHAIQSMKIKNRDHDLLAGSQ